MSNHHPRKKSNRIRAFRMIAALCILLGVANAWYGDRRNNRYEVLLREAEQKLSEPDTNKEQQIRYINRLKARFSFYTTVENGGRIFLGIGLLLIGGSFSFFTTSKSPDSNKNPT